VRPTTSRCPKPGWRTLDVNVFGSPSWQRSFLRRRPRRQAVRRPPQRAARRPRARRPRAPPRAALRVILPSLLAVHRALRRDYRPLRLTRPSQLSLRWLRAHPRPLRQRMRRKLGPRALPLQARGRRWRWPRRQAVRRLPQRAARRPRTRRPQSQQAVRPPVSALCLLG